MLRTLIMALSAVFVGGQSPSAAPSRPPPAPLSFMDTTKIVPTGNYTLGYLNNTVENDCHIGVAKFQSATAGQVSQFSFGAFSQTANETCGIGFVLRSLPNSTQVGLSVSALFTDVVQPTIGTIEMIPFPVPSTALWNLESGRNYTITIQPFTWTSGNTAGGSVSSAVHCTFDVPYGSAGPQYGLAGFRGPTGLPCGSTPLTLTAMADNMALLMKLKGIPIPSQSPSPSPTPTTTTSATPTPTGTPTGTSTPTGTPTITDTPTPTLSTGATTSNTASNTRTPSRTPSVSYSPTPTSAPTPSPSPSPTPTPTSSLSFRATSSVTPTETPGPTDSPTRSAVAALGIGNQSTPVPPIQDHTVQMLAAGIGGGVIAFALVAFAARYRSAYLFIHKQPLTAKSWKNDPVVEVNNNPQIMKIRVTDKFMSTQTHRSKFETV